MNEVTAERVKTLLRVLIEDQKMTPVAISDALDGRVSVRTIYRWAQGKSTPQNSSDFYCLSNLVKPQ